MKTIYLVVNADPKTNNIINVICAFETYENADKFIRHLYKNDNLGFYKIENATYKQ